jgi:hypothetical protein
MIMKLLLSNSLPQDILSSEGNPQCPAEQLWQVISKPSLPAVVSALELRPKKKRTTQNVMHMRVYRHTHLIFGLHL